MGQPVFSSVMAPVCGAFQNNTFFGRVSNEFFWLDAVSWKKKVRTGTFFFVFRCIT